MTSRWNQYPSASRRSRGPGWKQLRAKVMQRDNWTCQLRGPHCAVIATDCDHIVNVANGGSDDMSNLCAACKPCHNTKTAREAAAGRNRWKRQPQPHPSDLLGGTPTDTRHKRTGQR